VTLRMRVPSCIDLDPSVPSNFTVVHTAPRILSMNKVQGRGRRHKNFKQSTFVLRRVRGWSIAVVPPPDIRKL
jgi:hypothetical protein